MEGRKWFWRESGRRNKRRMVSVGLRVDVGGVFALFLEEERLVANGSLGNGKNEEEDDFKTNYSLRGILVITSFLIGAPLIFCIIQLCPC